MPKPPKHVAVGLDPRLQAAFDQVNAVCDELEIAIAWADRPNNDGNPIVYGRNLRQMAQLLDAALKNMKPAPRDTLPAIIEDYRTRALQEEREAKSSQLTLNVPMQSRPAFANKAGAR